MELNELTQKIDIKWAEIQKLLKDYKAQQKPVTKVNPIEDFKKQQKEKEHFWQHFPRLKVHGTLGKSEVSGGYRFKLENISFSAVQTIRKITNNDYQTISDDLATAFRWENRKTFLVVPQKPSSKNHPESSYYFEMASLKSPKVLGVNDEWILFKDLSIGDTVTVEISIVTYDMLNSYYRPLHLTKEEYAKSSQSVYDLLSLKERRRPLQCFRNIETYDRFADRYYYDREVFATFTPIRAAYMHSLKVMQCKKDREVL